MISASALERLAGVRHGFFTRQGGVSKGAYTSLNCGLGSGDDKAHVAENRARAAAALGVASVDLCTPYQVHGRDVEVVERPWAMDERPRADALVTGAPGIALGVLTADCAPVLLADAEARVVGAAHAGWKGALAGVAQAVVEAMERLGAERRRMTAAVGPCIGFDSYEVGPEFPPFFLSQDDSNQRFFVGAAREGHYRFDLTGYVAASLETAGVAAVAQSGHDTLVEEDLFFSYRRTCLRGESGYGRCLSAIALSP